MSKDKKLKVDKKFNSKASGNSNFIQLKKGADIYTDLLVKMIEGSLKQYNDDFGTKLSIKITSSEYREKFSERSGGYAIRDNDIYIYNGKKKVHSFNLSTYSEGSYYIHPGNYEFINGRIVHNKDTGIPQLKSKSGNAYANIMQVLIQNSVRNKPRLKR